MPKLSRRSWNNVLIFVVLILMFVLYDIPQRLTESRHQVEARLVPENSELLMVAFTRQRLVKAGTQWQLQPVSLLNSIDANQLALAWQHTRLVEIEANVQSRVPVAQASLQLAGSREPLLWLLYPHESGFYLLQQTGAAGFYRLDASQAALLFPEAGIVAEQVPDLP